jgi:hypothetical protein
LCTTNKRNKKLKQKKKTIYIFFFFWLFFCLSRVFVMIFAVVDDLGQNLAIDIGQRHWRVHVSYVFELCGGVWRALASVACFWRATESSGGHKRERTMFFTVIDMQAISFDTSCSSSSLDNSFTYDRVVDDQRCWLSAALATEIVKKKKKKAPMLCEMVANAARSVTSSCDARQRRATLASICNGIDQRERCETRLWRACGGAWRRRFLVGARRPQAKMRIP